MSFVFYWGEVIVDNCGLYNDDFVVCFEVLFSWELVFDNCMRYFSGFCLSDGEDVGGDEDDFDGVFFFFWVPVVGEYSVYAWWSQVGYRSDSVNYRVYETEDGCRLFDGEVNQ